jgi:hypothetical protein
MSMATQRFEQLKMKFRQAVPGRRLSPSQQRAIILAANLQQVAELVIAEMVLGVPYDRGMVEKMQEEVRASLASAGVKSNTRERTTRK